MVTEMVLRGLSSRISDLTGRMRFCHPILSPKGNEAALFVATNIEWSLDKTGLKSVDRDEINSFGTLWPTSKSTMDPGVGVAVIGNEFMREVSVAVGRTEAGNLPFNWDGELGCWIAIGRRHEFDQCAKRLAALSRIVFDRELRRSASARNLSGVGAAALFVLRRTPGRRETDVAMRELAAANVQSEHDLYRRLLTVLSVKLDVPENSLDTQVKRYVESIRFADFVGELNPQDTRFVRPKKSVQVVSEPGTFEYDTWYSDYPSKTFYTYASKFSAHERVAVHSKGKVVRNTTIHDRPAKLVHTRRSRLGKISSGMWERIYEREWKSTQLTGKLVAGG